MKAIRRRSRVSDDSIVIAPIGRNFRQVLQDVQNGCDELGESVSPDAFTFPSAEDVDMSLEPPDLYVSRLKYGAIPEADFRDRLAERLGIEPSSLVVFDTSEDNVDDLPAE